MDISLITLLMFGVLVLILLTGMPLAFVIGGVAVLSTLFFWGPGGLSILSSVTFGVMQNFLLIAIPLFVFMGIVLQHSGVADALYEMIYTWIGGVRGGLAVGTIVICALFAAMCGVSAAATVTMGVIALPSMLSHNYSKRMAVGSIAAGGSLGILIPPSVLMIVYGVFSNESIGALFAGGVIPGLLLTGLFMAYIMIRSYLQPEMGPAVPREQRSTWGQKLRSLRSVALPLLLITLVLGSIFKGAATPTEAAAIGALGALLCAAASRRLTWKLIWTASQDTMRLTAMICWIIIAASCFTAIFTALGAIDFISDAVAALPVSPYLVLIGMQACLVVLGMILDPGGIIMICTPVFVPLIKTLGFDPVWFGVLFVINMEMGYLTPPFGFNLFYMKGIAPASVSMADIYRSVTPFVLLQALCLALVIIFPQLALWLPGLIMR